MSLQSRIRNVTAVLGPTNTGKTHLAIERMLGHATGMIGLPLRLLAREVYDKIAARVGAGNVALITGEEKIKPDHPRFWVSTVEAMPREVETDFLAIDEVQLCADADRGHVFTDRMLNARGREETLLLGAGTMREAINDLIPGANFISRPRLSKITYAGQKKTTRLPKRTAIVAFSAAEVYEIAELIRRQLGGAAVVLGALSPRTRNAQVALYQSGDVDYLVATDAIGMGLNLDVDHVAFAATRKFDGHQHRNLTAAEIGQIAGRAGRHMNDGTFGVTGDAEPFDADMIERIESHVFDSVRTLQWRNPDLDFATLDKLRESLREAPREIRLQRARMAEDVLALETLSASREIAERTTSRDAVVRLWEVCQVPDYRKISSQNHAELVATLYGFLSSDGGRIPEDWFAKQVEMAARTDGDIDTLASRIAHIRTWTFVANRSDWLADPVHWQERTRATEDALSDAMHEQLTQRFVDLKTSALMRGLRSKDELTADISSDGSVHVEKHFVGKLKGFRFQPDTTADAQGVHGKASRGAAAHVLANEFSMRARRVAAAKTDAFKLTRSARVLWRDEEIARLEAAEDPLKPTVLLLSDEHLSGPDKEKVQTRLDAWIGELIGDKLKPLVELKNAEDVTGLARGIAFRMVESFGSLRRETIAEDMRHLDQPSRAQLRKYGVRFGAFNIFLPLLLKPAAADLTLTLWSLKNAAASDLSVDAMPEPPRPGLTSAAALATTPEAFYRAAGYHVCGPRAIRMDILERLADQIRPLMAWRKTEPEATAPRGSSGDGGFYVLPEMMSALGCSSEELGHVLRSLGFRAEKRPAPPKQPRTPKSPPRAAIEAAPPVAEEAVVAAEAATPIPTPEEPVAEAAPQPVPQVIPETAQPVAAAAEPVAETEPSTPAEPMADATAGMALAAAVAAEGGSDQSASVTPAETDSTSQGDKPAAEPDMIDVWRPRRRDRGERHGQRGERPERGGERANEPGERRPRPGGNRDRGPQRNRNDRRPGQQTPTPAVVQAANGSDGAAVATAPSGDTAPAAQVPAEPKDGDSGRRDRHQGRDNRERRDNRDNRDNRSAQPRDRDRDPRGPRPGGGPDRRDNRRDDRRGGGGGDRRPDVRTASPQRKGGPDPDSPFAALAALKSQLEKQTKDRT